MKLFVFKAWYGGDSYVETAVNPNQVGSVESGLEWIYPDPFKPHEGVGIKTVRIYVGPQMYSIKEGRLEEIVNRIEACARA